MSTRRGELLGSGPRPPVQNFHESLDRACRNNERHARACDHASDADHLRARVKDRTTRIAWRKRDVDLDQIAAHISHPTRIAHTADHAERGHFAKPQRMPQCYYQLANAQILRPSQRYWFD